MSYLIQVTQTQFQNKLNVIASTFSNILNIRVTCMHFVIEIMGEIVSLSSASGWQRDGGWSMLRCLCQRSQWWDCSCGWTSENKRRWLNQHTRSLKARRSPNAARVGSQSPWYPEKHWEQRCVFICERDFIFQPSNLKQEQKCLSEVISLLIW